MTAVTPRVAPAVSGGEEVREKAMAEAEHPLLLLAQLPARSERGHGLASAVRTGNSSAAHPAAGPAAGTAPAEALLVSRGSGGWWQQGHAFCNPEGGETAWERDTEGPSWR